MPGFIARLLINVLGIWLASEIVSGISYASTQGLVAAALILAFVNALVRPIAVLLTIPITILSFGLFLLVINGAMISLVGWLVPDFNVDTLGAGVLAAIIVSLTGWVTSRFIGPRGFEAELTE